MAGRWGADDICASLSGDSDDGRLGIRVGNAMSTASWTGSAVIPDGPREVIRLV